MSNFEYKREGREVTIIASGSIQDVAIEIGHMIRGIHNGIKTQNPLAAKMFQKAMQALMTDDSPAWTQPKHHDGGIMIAMVTESDRN